MSNTNEHNHDPKQVTIYINSDPRVVDKGKISFDQIVSMAFPGLSEDEWAFTVTYERGNAPHPQGILVKGKDVEVVEGMRFNVTKTVRS